MMMNFDDDGLNIPTLPCSLLTWWKDKNDGDDDGGDGGATSRKLDNYSLGKARVFTVFR